MNKNGTVTDLNTGNTYGTPQNTSSGTPTQTANAPVGGTDGGAAATEGQSFDAQELIAKKAMGASIGGGDSAFDAAIDSGKMVGSTFNMLNSAAQGNDQNVYAYGQQVQNYASATVKDVNGALSGYAASLGPLGAVIDSKAFDTGTELGSRLYNNINSQSANAPANQQAGGNTIANWGTTWQVNKNGTVTDLNTGNTYGTPQNTSSGTPTQTANAPANQQTSEANTLANTLANSIDTDSAISQTSAP